MNYKNPIRLDNGCIDCEIEARAGRWFPFTADPNDSEELGRDIWARADAELTAQSGVNQEAIKNETD